MLASSPRLAQASPSELEQTQTGMGGRPTASVPEHRPGEDMAGPPPTEAAQVPPAPAEEVRLPPASRGIGKAPSRLSWVP